MLNRLFGRPLRAGAAAAVLAGMIAAVVAFAVPALGDQPKDVTVDPQAQQGAPGLVALDGTTYADAKQQLTTLQQITLPVAIPGLQAVHVTGVALDSDDADRSLALTGTAQLPAIGGGQTDVDFAITAQWADATSTTPQIALGAKASDLSLGDVNPLWGGSYGSASFDTARLVVANFTGTLDPQTLPGSVQGFYDAPIDVAPGVAFRGDLHLDGRLADAFGYAGWSGDVTLEGSLGGSPALLFGDASDDELGGLRLTATLGKSPTAPSWMADRTSTFALGLVHTDAGWRPTVHVSDDVTVAAGGTQNEFAGSFDVDPSGALHARLAVVGPLDLPYGLDALQASDVALGLDVEHDDAGAAKVTGSLDLGVALADHPDPVTVHAELGTGGGETSATVAVDGSLGVDDAAHLTGRLLGTPDVSVPGADGVSLDGISFTVISRASGEKVVSLGARATIESLQAQVLLSLRHSPGEATQPLLGLRLSDPGCTPDCVRLSSLLPADQLGSIASGLKLPALELTVAGGGLTSLAKDDLTPEEQDFFTATEPDLPDTIDLVSGVGLKARLPLDALGDDVRSVFGYDQGAEVELAGSLGFTLDQLEGGGSSLSLKDLDLEATLPGTRGAAFLPSWVDETSPTRLALSYADGAVQGEFDTGAHLTIGGTGFDTTLGATIGRNGQRTTVSFHADLGGWQHPFGADWIDSVDDAGLEVDSSFGGPTPTSIEAAVHGSVVLGGNTFSLELGLARDDSTSAHVTASYGGSLTLGDVVGLFPALSDAATRVGADDALQHLTIRGISATAQLGSGASSAFELSAQTSFSTPSGTDLDADMLVAARASGFTLGIKPTGTIHVHDFTAAAPNVDVELPAAALVLSSQDTPLRPSDLTDGEFDFYKTLYGCDAEATRDSCKDFTKLDATKGLRLLASFRIPDELSQLAAKAGVDTSTAGLIEGTVPVLGGNDFSLRAELGNFHFDQQPDWFDHGDVALKVGTDGVSFTGDLTLKMRRQGDWTEESCPAGGWIEDHCYDLLTFSLGSRLSLEPLSFTLTGALETQADTPWHPFGVGWLQVRHLGLVLGVTLAEDGPAVELGFQGDISVGDKDVAGTIDVAVPPPPDPPVLLGVSAASNSGVALSDVVKLANDISGSNLSVDTKTMPDVSLRNFLFQYSQKRDDTLCLTPGVHFNADLYVGSNLPAPDPPQTSDGGCRTIQTHPAEGQSCQDHASQGCLASVYGSIDSSGIDVGGDLSAFTLGPISFDNSHVGLTLTASEQRLSMHGHAKIASPGYTFADGMADLDFSRDGFKFSSDAQILGDAFHGYVDAEAAPLDFSSVPSFYAKVWLRADANAAINQAISTSVQGIKPVIVGIGGAVDTILGNGGVSQLHTLRSQLVSAGVPVPQQLDTVIDGIATAQDQINRYGGPGLTVNALLRGFDISSPGTPGFYVPSSRQCLGPYAGHDSNCSIDAGLFDIPGKYVDPQCVTTMVDGTCYSIPPFDVHVPGVCDAIGIDHSSPDCSWNGLMSKYVLPAVVDAFNRATGLHVQATNLQDLVDQLVSALSNPNVDILDLQCAEFEGDARQLAQGRASVTLATRMRLFGQPISLGARWDFGDLTGSAASWDAQLLQQLLSPHPATCPDIPAGHEQQEQPDAAQGLQASLSPTTVDENGQVTLTASFTNAAAHYPALAIDWGDGSSDTIPAGDAQTVTMTHRYLDDGPKGLGDAQYEINAVVQDGGGAAQQLTADVRNVAPSIQGLDLDSPTIDENGQATVTGRFADPGTQDHHEVTLDWGDGTAPETVRVPLGDRTFQGTHRYLDNPQSGDSYTISARVADDDGGSDSATTPISVRNVAPSAVTLKPTALIAGTGGPSDDGSSFRIDEGAIVQYAIDFADPGSLDGHTVTVDWADGSDPTTVKLAPGTTHVDLPHRYLDDRSGGYATSVTVTDKDGGTGSASPSLDVHNVAPTVQATIDKARFDEGGSATVSGAITDPGVRDDQTVVIDWGAGRSGDDRTTTIHLPADQRTFSATKPYGDDGSFTIAAQSTDKDGGQGATSVGLTVDNVAPTAAIDSTGSVAAPGGRTFIARAGTPLRLRAHTTDPGSDDLTATWTWQDGTSTRTPYLVDPPGADPHPSPQVDPRDLVDEQPHTWAAPCLYTGVRFDSADDDGGAAADTAAVVVTGTDSHVRGSGAWQAYYRQPDSPDLAACYLRIVGHMSAVFGELRDASTPAAAFGVLHPASPNEDEHDKLDRELLTTWLNFAAGSLAYGDIADTVRHAETVRSDPNATQADLRAQRQALQRLDGD